MNDTDKRSLRESLSAFADGEYGDNDPAIEAEMISRICQDEYAKSSWASMHLARDVMQGDYLSALPSDFASRISESIAHEEVYAMDVDSGYAATNQLEDNSAGVVSMAQARDKLSQRRDRANRAASRSKRPFVLWKPVAGLGLAASLAGAVFVGSQLVESEQPDSSSVAAVQQEQSTDVVAVAQQNAIDTQSAATLRAAVRNNGNGGTRWRTDQDTSRNDTMEERLNILLTNHLEDASMGSVNGLISHSKVVGYDSMPEKEKSE